MKEFTVWNHEEGETKENGRVIQAVDAAEACELWAEHDDVDSAEYGIVGGVDVVVTVELEDGKTEQYQVSGEAVPAYSAWQQAKQERGL